MIRSPNGSVQVSWAPSAGGEPVGLRPEQLEGERDAEADEQAGHDQARDRQVEDEGRSAESAAGSARPAITDSTTVSDGDDDREHRSSG